MTSAAHTEVDVEAAQGCNCQLLPALSRLQFLTETPCLMKPEDHHA